MAEQRSGGGKKPANDSEAQNQECDALEDALARLRAAYEQYFMGTERHPPLALHTTLRQRLEKLKTTLVRSAVIKFRIGNFAQKVSTYERLWSRTLSEIENGTYRRDLFKAKRRQQQAAEEKKKQEAPKSLEAPPPEARTSGGAVATPPKTPGARERAMLSDERVRAIYEAYVAAKKQCREDISKLSVESLAMTLRKQVPDLLKRHQAQAVDFRVVIKDGKAVLRAVPK